MHMFLFAFFFVHKNQSNIYCIFCCIFWVGVWDWVVSLFWFD